MKSLLLSLITGAAILGATLQPLPAVESGQIALYVGRLLEQGHYTRQPLDDGISAKILQTYVDSLDYNKLFFTEEDMVGLREKYGSDLDDYLLLGNPKPATEIYKLFRERVEKRVAFVEEFLKTEPDFNSDRTIEISRQKSAWPKDTAAADQLWRDRVTGELLQAKLNEHSTEKPLQVVSRRYRQLLRNVKEKTEDEVVSGFLQALSLAYDPHSEYMDADALENFQINMKLSLVGIGAVLRSEDGYAKIMELVPGGPAQLEGHLQVNDRISAVSQGNLDFEEVVDMQLDKVVKLIRGEKGTVVRLQVIPANATDPSTKKVIEIVRDEVKLKEQEAKAEVIDRIGPDGKKERLGWITLPSFYADMRSSRSETDAKSTTRDVTRLLERLKKEKISGLVMDLRRNGGGSLEEAVNLTGVFLNGGPIVQAKNSQGEVTISKAESKPPVYDGPMVVLTSRLSASASEIFAAALQDYKRAVVVGDESTFGKGTVQTMLEIGRMMSPLGLGSVDAGALKLTIQQFYRVNGGSTQLRGVLSDIVLPTITDDPQIGESALKNPLPYDEIEPAKIDIFSEQSLPLAALRQRSEGRVEASREFAYVREDITMRRTRLDENAFTLDEKQRRKEIEADKARIEKRKTDRAKANLPAATVYSVTLDNVDMATLEIAVVEKKKFAEEENEALVDDFDAERFEALNIVSDLASMQNHAATAQITKPAPSTP